MRSYFLDELYPEHLALLAQALAEKGMSGSLDGLFFLPVPEELLDAEQVEHMAECGPYALALEVGDEWARLEFLVRARGKLRCSCVRYANAGQRAYAMDWLDTLLRGLDIPA